MLLIRNYFKIFIIFILFSLTTTSFATPFIIDTDAAFDDGLAILYLLKQPKSDIKAIIIAPTGEARCASALKNIHSLVTLFNKKIPIACGRATPLMGLHKFPLDFTNAADSMNGLTDSLPKINAPRGNGVTLLIETLRKSPVPMNILVLGPLTNLAEALLKNPGIKNKINEVYIMGGAIDVPGNIHSFTSSMENETAEWNFYIDPKADDIVFKSGVKITLIPLDATNVTPFDQLFYEAIEKIKPTDPAGKLIHQFYITNKKTFLEPGWYYWDVFAAIMFDAAMYSPEEAIASFKNVNLRIVLEPEKISGTTVVDEKNGNPVKVCFNPKQPMVMQHLIQRFFKTNN